MAYNSTIKHFVTRLDGGVIWAPFTQYSADDVVVNGTMMYKALVGHTASSVFATDHKAAYKTYIFSFCLRCVHFEQ
jgi:hypothetical protein